MSSSIKSAVRRALAARATAFTTATALFGFAAAVQAQEASSEASATEGAETIEEVVVTGFRASLNKAIEAKKDQVGAIDMIVAEDIADFPDLNLAESLQRIPGVVIARDAGEGRQISVRGLGPQFTRVRINGVEAMSANGGTDAAGGTNRSRNFDFNTFASELFSNITIRKSAAAEIEEGSLGATVDLRAARPFDYEGLTIAGGAQGGYNDLGKDIDPRGTFLISNTFADGKFGALLSVAYTKRQLTDEGSSTVRWTNGGANVAGQPRAFCNSATPSTPNNNCFLTLDPTYAASGSTATLDQINDAFHPRIPRYDQYFHEQERLGVTASLQFAPNDATTVSLDTLFAKFDAERQEIFLEAPVFSTGGNGMAPTTAININDVNPVAAVIDNTNTLVYGVFNDVDVRSEARFDKLSTEFTQVTLDVEHKFSDSVKLTGLVGFAESNHDNPVQTTLLFDSIDVDGYSYDFRGNKRLPLITYGRDRFGNPFNARNPAIWTLSQVRLRPQSTINSFQTASIDLEWAFSDAFKLKFGPDWKNYVFKSTEVRRTNGTTANQETNVTAALAAAPLANYSRLVSGFGRNLDLPAGTTTSWLIPDVSVATSVLGLDNRTIYPLGIQPALGNNNEIEEDDQGAYVQGDFSFDLGGHTLRGNAGVRYVKTDLTSTGYTFQAGAGGGVVLQTVENDYSDVLPSFNLVYDISEALLVRLSGAKVMTRPNLGNLAPGSAVSVSGNNRTVTAGNPDLDPFRAKSYDASVEWYFAPESLLSLALFYKDVETFVTNQRFDIQFTGNPLNIPDSVATAACGATAGCSPAAIWAFTIPANTEGGKVKGFELSYQQPFSFLPGVWSNFGTILNYTHAESAVNYLNSAGRTVEGDLAGLSDASYNATLYFDNKVYSARVSAAYRSEYLTTIPGRDRNDVEGTAATMNIDFSTTYNINDHFAVSLEALNLTDEVQDQWVDSVGDRLSFYHHQGRQYFLGGRFKF